MSEGVEGVFRLNLLAPHDGAIGKTPPDGIQLDAEGVVQSVDGTDLLVHKDLVIWRGLCQKDLGPARVQWTIDRHTNRFKLFAIIEAEPAPELDACTLSPDRQLTSPSEEGERSMPHAQEGEKSQPSASVAEESRAQSITAAETKNADSGQLRPASSSAAAGAAAGVATQLHAANAEATPSLADGALKILTPPAKASAVLEKLEPAAEAKMQGAAQPSDMPTAFILPPGTQSAAAAAAAAVTGGGEKSGGLVLDVPDARWKVKMALKLVLVFDKPGGVGSHVLTGRLIIRKATGGGAGGGDYGGAGGGVGHAPGGGGWGEEEEEEVVVNGKRSSLLQDRDLEIFQRAVVSGAVFEGVRY
jgi:hypothetical protein